MSRSSRFACVVMLLLMAGSIAMPVYAASGACIGMSCHKDRSDRVGEPMSHDCCGTSVCADAPPATSETAVTVQPAPAVATITYGAALPAGAPAHHATAATSPSPPPDTGMRLALLSTLLI